MDLKTERGRSIGKVKTLQDLAKRWWLISKEKESGNIGKPQWDDGIIEEAVWRERTQTVAEEYVLYS